MTQILSGICSEGIMVATDSVATTFDENGEEKYFSVDKLFPLGSHAFIVSGGMGISVQLSRKFKEYAEQRRLLGIEKIIAVAGPYLSERLSEALRKHGNKRVETAELDRIYFVAGGYSFKEKDASYQLAFWASETGKPPLERIKIGQCLAVPRTMSGELRLFQMCQRDCQLAQLIEFASDFLQKQAAVDPQVGPPFWFGTVTSSGFSRFSGDRLSKQP
jgi:hypothetical protein